jgi:uncharacterized protein (DUF983 family)
MRDAISPAAISPLAAALKPRCPRCGQGRLFRGFLHLERECTSCGLSYDFADSGDGPAIFIMLIVGFLIVAAALVVEVVYQPPYWLHALLWLPLVIILSLGLLRPLKAFFIAQQYRKKAREGRLTKE